MSWINFYMRIIPISTEDDDITKSILEFDEALYRSDLIWIENNRRNRGKFVPVIDDITGEPLTHAEIRELDERRDSSPTVIFPFVDEDLNVNSKPAKRKRR